MKENKKEKEFVHYKDNYDSVCRYINPHMLHIINQELNKPIKNDKPDGRRYKK